MLALRKGTQLASRYTLLRPLGRGGEAETWLARDRLTSANVALKIVSGRGPAAARLHDEWQTSLRLLHPNIVRVFEFHEDESLAFYSLQHVDGPDIGVLSGAAPADILGPVGLIADALRYAHGRGIVHRDVRAANILVDHHGVPYLTDFGVAAAAGETAGGGALIARSPQSLDGLPVQPADDVFALGGLLYELLAGAPPYSGGAVEHDIRHTSPPPLRAADGTPLPAAVTELATRMLDKDALRRPTAGEVAERLADAGFPAGPTGVHIDATPPAVDERIESVAAVRRAPETSVSASQAATGRRAAADNRKLVAGAFAVLVVVLLGVVFVLPDRVERAGDDRGGVPEADAGGRIDAQQADADEEAAGSARVSRDYEPGSRGLDNERIEFNENDADFSGLDDNEKLRFKVDMILGELLSDFETLERRSVQRWAPVAYEEAREHYAAGDAAYLRKNFEAAEASYLDALTVLEPLFERVEPEFDKALSGAEAAFAAGDRAEALRLYELAVAITPNHPEARAGFERAQNLDTVLRLVDQGLDYEEDLELDAAERSFAQAVELDPAWAPASEGLERVQRTRVKLEFDTRMSEGLEALAAGDYLAARAAFRVAERLMPGSPEPADGLMQVDQGLRLQNIETLQGEAMALEAAEHWDAASATYEEILGVDPNLTFAIEGLERSRRMHALHTQLDEYIEDPDRLASPSVQQQATRLVVDITRMGEIGPRLAAQRDELSRLLKRAVTPVRVEFVSDNQTAVTIYKVGSLGSFTNRELELRPGTYVAVGVRPGFRDVRLEFRVAPEIDMQPVTVRCEEPI